MSPVPFSMTDCFLVGEPFGGEALVMTFRPVQPADDRDGGGLHSVSIAGLAANALLSVRVADDAETVFELEADRDPLGRTVSGGDMLAAIFGLGPGRCLRVLESEFLQTLATCRATVQLRVRLRPGVSIEDVRVEGNET